jgi:hypothetical protein
MACRNGNPESSSATTVAKYQFKRAIAQLFSFVCERESESERELMSFELPSAYL